jgi:NitT/TauT family transport system permease protein
MMNNLVTPLCGRVSGAALAEKDVSHVSTSNAGEPPRGGALVQSALNDKLDAVPENTADTDAGEPRESWFAKHQRFFIGLAALLVVAAAWQLATEVFHLENVNFASSPSRIAAAEWQYFIHGNGFSDASKTGTEFLLGLALAIAVGIPVGIAIGWYPVASAICEPFINLLYATPFVALAPLFVLWFGIGLESKVAVVFAASIISIVVTTAAGVRTVENSLVSVARTYRANSFQIFRTLVLPGTLPSITSGIRLATGHALTGAIVAELIASTGGVGYFINTASTSFDPDQTMAGIAVVAFAGLVLASILRKIERKLDAWRVA